jgi:GNAT superfamily N-acetyltransferase
MTALAKPKPNYDIVPFEPRYAPVFDRLNRAWIEEYFWVEPLDNEVLTKPEIHIIGKDGEVWFAVRDGVAIATYALIKHTDSMYEFTKLGVDPSARGEGIARALLYHATARAKAKGAEVLRIFTATKLIPACTLYRSEGFQEVAMSAEERTRYQRADIMFDLPLN